jgi:hypothetical protein
LFSRENSGVLVSNPILPPSLVLISDAPVQRYNSIAVPDELELPLWFLGLAGRFLHEKLCHLCVV